MTRKGKQLEAQWCVCVRVREGVCVCFFPCLFIGLHSVRTYSHLRLLKILASANGQPPIRRKEQHIWSHNSTGIKTSLSLGMRTFEGWATASTWSNGEWSLLYILSVTNWAILFQLYKSYQQNILCRIGSFPIHVLLDSVCQNVSFFSPNWDEFAEMGMLHAG